MRSSHRTGRSLWVARIWRRSNWIWRTRLWGGPEFLTKYPASLATAGQFVDAVLATIQTDLGVNLSGERNNLITLYNSLGRGGVMYRLADDNVQTNPINNRALIDAEYNRSFVLGQYFGYLRRNPDISRIRLLAGPGK